MIMDICNAVRFHFKGVKGDGCEKASNCLLQPLRVGLGYRSWDVNSNALTSKTVRVCMAIFAFTIYLLPTLIGLALWKISKTHLQHCQTMKKVLMQQKRILPVTPVIIPQTPEIMDDPKNVSKAYSSNPVIVPSVTSTNAVQLPTSFSVNVPYVIPAKLSGLLEKIEEFNKRLDKLSQTEKNALGIDLEDAYTQTIAEFKAHPDTFIPSLSATLSRILYLEAKRNMFVNGSKEEGLTLLQGALFMRTLPWDFHTIETSFAQILTLNPSLGSLKKSSVQPNHPFERIMERLMDNPADTNINDFIERTQDIRFQSPADLIMSIATIIGAIGDTCLKIKKYQNERLERILDVSKGLFKYLDTPDSKWRIVHLLFKTCRALHLFKHPGDLKGALAALDEIKPFIAAEGNSLRAKGIRINIIDINRREREKLCRTLPHSERIIEYRKSFEEACEAVQIIETIPNYDKKRKWHFLSFRIHYALYCNKTRQNVIAWKEVGSWVDAYMKIMRQENFKYERFILSALDAATYGLRCKPKLVQHALGSYKIALQIYEKFKGTSTHYLKDIEKFERKYGKELGIALPTRSTQTSGLGTGTGVSTANVVHATIPSFVNVPYALPAKLNNLFEEMREVYKRIDTLSQAEMDAWRIDLEAAYTQTIAELKARQDIFTPELLTVLSRILYFEAHRNWNSNNMEEVLTLFQGSLLLWGYNYDYQTFEKTFANIFTLNPSLDAIRKSSKQPNHPFEHVMKVMKDNPVSIIVDSYIELQENAQMSWHTNILYSITDMILALGLTCMQIKKYQGEHDLLGKLFEVVKDLHKHINTPVSKWQIVINIFNHSQSFHLLKHPGDIRGALATLDEIEPYLAGDNSERAQIMRLNILETKIAKRPGLLKKLPHSEYLVELQKIFEDFCNSLEICETIPGFEKQKKWELLAERIFYAFQCLKEKINIVSNSEIVRWIEEHMLVMQQENYNHEGFVLDALYAAEYEVYMSNNTKALEHYNLAKRIYDKFKGTSTRYLKEIEKFETKHKKQLGLP